MFPPPARPNPKWAATPTCKYFHFRLSFQSFEEVKTRGRLEGQLKALKANVETLLEAEHLKLEEGDEGADDGGEVVDHEVDAARAQLERGVRVGVERRVRVDPVGVAEYSKDDQAIIAPACRTPIQQDATENQHGTDNHGAQNNF